MDALVERLDVLEMGGDEAGGEKSDHVSEKSDHVSESG